MPLRTATARTSPTLHLRHGNGAADALAETTTFADFSLSIDFLVPLIYLEVPLSAALPSLSSILRFLLSLATLHLRDRTAHAATPLIPLPRDSNLSADV